jgi:transposase
VPVEKEACEDVQFKQRAVFEFLTAEKMSPVDIHRRMQAVCGDKCVDVSTVIRWVRHFEDEEVGDPSLCDKAGSRRPAQNSETC